MVFSAPIPNADELIKMSREKALPDISEETPVPEDKEQDFTVTEESELLPFDNEQKQEKDNSAERISPSDIPGIEAADFYEETIENNSTEEVPMI